MNQRAFEPGEVIFREGEKSEEAYGIISGEVQISIDTKAGPRVLSQLYPGEIFGEMGMVDDKPRSATAIASKKTVIQVITMDKFIEYLMSDAGRLSAYLGTVFERLRVSDLKLKIAPHQETKYGCNSRRDHSLENLFSGKTSEEGEKEPHQTIRLVSAGSSSDSHEAVLTKFPFRIGRLDVSGESSPSENNTLSYPGPKALPDITKSLLNRSAFRSLLRQGSWKHAGDCRKRQPPFNKSQEPFPGVGSGRERDRTGTGRQSAHFPYHLDLSFQSLLSATTISA